MSKIEVNDNQECFDALSELEEYFYYREQNPEDIPYAELAKMHDTIKKLMLKWHTLTGCTNSAR